MNAKTRTPMATLLMVAVAGVLTPAAAVAAPPAPTTSGGAPSAAVSLTARRPPTTIRCNIPRVGYGPCSSDNLPIRPGHKVCLALISSGGKAVRFQVRNLRGEHLLSIGPWQPPNGKYYFQWTNNTSRTITTDVFADAKGLRRVSAVARIKVVGGSQSC